MREVFAFAAGCMFGFAAAIWLIRWAFMEIWLSAIAPKKRTER